MDYTVDYKGSWSSRLEHIWCLPRTLSVEQISKYVYVVQFCSTWSFLYDLWKKIALHVRQFCSTVSVSSWLMQKKKPKSLVRGAEMKNIAYALELPCSSCIYIFFLPVLASCSSLGDGKGMLLLHVVRWYLYTLPGAGLYPACLHPWHSCTS